LLITRRADINGYEAMGTIPSKIEKDYDFYEASEFAASYTIRS